MKTRPTRMNEPHDLSTLDALKSIVATLRGPQGCPWDKEQTPVSLIKYVIEEAFELADAIDRNHREDTIEELGDYLFQVALQIQIAQESAAFDWAKVLETLNIKMIRRHPHVFGDESAANSTEVLKRWNELKAQEKALKKSQRPLEVSQGLPALVRAQKLGEKSQKANFDWDTPEHVWLQFESELDELKQAWHDDRKHRHAVATDHLREEIGDVFFTLVQLCRHLNLEAEAVLRESNRKFENRFQAMYEDSKLPLNDFLNLSAEQKQVYWDRIKGLREK